jgi:hypothetical protein
MAKELIIHFVRNLPILKPLPFFYVAESNIPGLPIGRRITLPFIPFF